MSTLEVKAIQAPTGFDLQMPAGAILQVVNANTSNSVVLSSTTYTDTGLTATITPKFASSKILVMATVAINHGNDEGCGIKLIRNSTTLYTSDNPYTYIYAVGGDSYNRGSIYELDSPSTTSSTTYKIQFSAYDNKQIKANHGARSEIVLMEVAG
jgi:hypothetical protein